MRKLAKKRRNGGGTALAPYSLWALLFIVVPMGFIAYYAFTDNSFNFTTDNISRFFTSVSNIRNEDGSVSEVHTYLFIFSRSLKLAVISTVICFITGYPLAYRIANAKKRTQQLMMTLIMIPMWMNFLIRTYAWMTILQDSGILNNIITRLGMAPIHIIGTETAVIIGMVYDYLPYMVLPIYSVLVKLDYSLVEAARDLGCGSFSVLRRVVFPLSLPGVLSGITMVLIPSISTFYISQKLGNGKFFLIGDAIEGQYVANNLHFAAAMAFILMVVLLEAVRNTLVLAASATAISTIMGTAAAWGIDRLCCRWYCSAISTVTDIPMTNPDIITGISLMLMFVFVGRIFGARSSLNFWTMLISHVTFCLPYVILQVLPKLQQMDKSLSEAAMDLGCSPFRAFLKVELHEMLPGIATGAIMAFTMSLDDFVISYFTSGTGFETLPIRIYSMTKKTVTPKMYALATIIFFVTLSLLLISNFISNAGSEEARNNKKAKKN